MATGTQSIYKGSDEIPKHDCNVCLSNGITSEAISYCTICCEYMCKLCDMAHNRFRATNNHVVFTGIDMPTMRTKQTLPFVFCDTHRTSLLDIYCITHDEVICPTCKMTSHITCDINDVSKHSARLDVVKGLKKVAKCLIDLHTRYEDLSKNRTIDKSTMKTQIQSCLSDMRQLRQDFNEQLDLLEKQMNSEIRHTKKKMKKEIDSHITLADDILRQIGDLNTSLSECKETGKNDVMFVGMKKVASRASEYWHVIENVQKDIYPINIHVQPNVVLTDMIQQLQSLGTVVNNRPIYTGHTQTSVMSMSVKERQGKDVKSEDVLGCTFMSDGHLVLACADDGLKLFDKDLHFKSQLLTSRALDVSVINDTDVIITQGKLKQLQRVRVFPDMVVRKTLKMDRICIGVDVYGGEIYVTCHNNPGNGEVRVLNMDGEVLRRLGVDDGSYMFTMPCYIKVNRDGSQIFVSDWDTNIVTCLNNQCHVIYQYSDRDLKAPTGMYVDGEDDLLVCGAGFHNVHAVRHNGGKENVLLSKNDGIKHPRCISYRQSDGCLVVGLSQTAKTDNKLIIFKTR